MRRNLKEGEKAQFMGLKITPARGVKFRSQRCAQCCFEEMPELCFFLRCNPNTNTNLHYAIYEPKRHRKRVKGPLPF